MKEFINNNKNINKINVLMDGGLGNQIFQYLAGRFISKELGFDLVEFFHKKKNYPAIKNLIDCSEIKIIPISKYKKNLKIQNKIHFKYRNFFNKLDQYFQYKLRLPILSNNLILKEDINFPNKKYNLKACINHSKYLTSKFNYKRFNITLDGFWQDPIQFKENIEYLTNEFFERLLPYNEENNLKPNSYIVIHARRGDYINNFENCKEYYSNYSFISFIMASLNIIPSELDNFPLLLITDDVEWFQKFSLQRLSFIKREIIICNGDEIKHWHFINNARLNIISNSSFSFTAALLNRVNSNEKLRIIMPFWYNNKTSMLEKGWARIEGAIAI